MSHLGYLVRHGQSEWNLRRLTQGQTAHPRLTELGCRQAHAAARAVAADAAAREFRVRRVISSDLVRATQTAEIIADRLGCPVALDPRLREQHLGRLEGRGYEETWAAADEIDWSDPTVRIGGGESLLQVYERMADILADVSREPGWVLVSHGDAMRAAAAALHGFRPHQAPFVEVPNGAVARVGGTLAWLDPESSHAAVPGS